MKINRRAFVAGLGAGALAGLGGLGNRYIHSSRKRYRPNIILFVADDMRFDTAGFNGNTIVKTPNLDRLAGEGFVFDNNFVTTSVCPISRASIWSGDYALKHGVYDFYTPMRPASFTHSFPALLRKSGYYTCFIGKWGVGLGHPLPVKLFNEWYGYENQGDYFPIPGRHIHMTDIETNQATRFLKTRPHDRPFLLVVAYKAPHGPLLPQDRFMGLYTKDFARAATDTPKAAARLPLILQQSAGRKGYFEQIGDHNKYQNEMKNYSRLVAGIDDSVGRIMEQVSQQHMADETAVFFTSDNGSIEGEHGLCCKWVMYEESIRVPFFIRPAPAYFPMGDPAHLSSMSLNVDISPTIMAMAGIRKPKPVQGQNLLPLLSHEKVSWRDGFYYEHPAWPSQAIWACEGYRGAQWKYTKYMRGKEVNECLYDLDADREEMNNLAGKPEFNHILVMMRAKTAHERKLLTAA